MTTPSKTVREFSVDSRGSEPAAMSATRPLYWSVRRELFENRSIYIAPLVVAAVVLLGSSISLIGLAARIQALATPDGAEQRLHRLGLAGHHAADLHLDRLEVGQDRPHQRGENGRLVARHGGHMLTRMNQNLPA